MKGADVQSGGEKVGQLEKRTGDPSAVAGASILASLSNFRADLSRWKSPAQSTSNVNQITEEPAHSVTQDGTDIEVDGMEGNSAPSIETDKVADAGANGSHDHNTDIEAGNVKLSGFNDFIRPFLKKLAESPSFNLKLSKSIFKQVVEEINEGTQPASTSAKSLKCELFKEEVLAEIIDGKNVDVSFDSFPYYLR